MISGFSITWSLRESFEIIRREFPESFATSHIPSGMKLPFVILVSFFSLANFFFFFLFYFFVVSGLTTREPLEGSLISCVFADWSFSLIDHWIILLHPPLPLSVFFFIFFRGGGGDDAPGSLISLFLSGARRYLRRLPLQGIEWCIWHRRRANINGNQNPCIYLVVSRHWSAIASSRLHWLFQPQIQKVILIRTK